MTRIPGWIQSNTTNKAQGAAQRVQQPATQGARQPATSPTATQQPAPPSQQAAFAAAGGPAAQLRAAALQTAKRPARFYPVGGGSLRLIGRQADARAQMAAADAQAMAPGAAQGSDQTAAQVATQGPAVQNIPQGAAEAARRNATAPAGGTLSAAAPGAAQADGQALTGEALRNALAEANQEAAASLEKLQEALSAQDDQAKTLLEQMKEAKEQAEKMREKFKIPKDARRYGFAAMEAYARLARARNQGQLSTAVGYARRQLAACQSALRQDPDNAGRIRSAIQQLQGAVTRAGRKKRQLTEEQRAKQRIAKAEKERQTKEALRRRQELRRRQTMRTLRERGYLCEAGIAHMQQEQIAADRAAAQQRAEQLGVAVNQQTAVQAYTAAVSAAAPATEPAATAGPATTFTAEG